MKKNIKTTLFAVVAVIVCIGITTLLVSLLSGQKFDADNADKQVQISWSEVNLRSKPSTNGDLVDTLHKGETVILTGYSYEYIGDGESFDSWVEVITHEDGVSGWIVTKSVDW